MTEQTLHEQLKELYSQEIGDKEAIIGDYRVDVVRRNLLIEIQTRSFSSIRDKLRDLTKENRVKLVHPIANLKWITRLDEKGEQISSRKSPKKGKVEEIFHELVYLPKLLMDPNFELEVVLVNMEEYWIDDGKGSWRRRKWSIYDKKMITLHKRHQFRSPTDFVNLIPKTLPRKFTSKQLSKEASIRFRLAQKMLYCLTKMKIVERNGKKGRAYIYSIN
ncbi:MAG: hypothetical protein ACXAEX_22630 [Promethearchaeota archaeon]